MTKTLKGRYAIDLKPRSSKKIAPVLWAIEETVTTLEKIEIALQWQWAVAPCSSCCPEKRQEQVGEEEGTKMVRGKLQLVPFTAPENQEIFHLVQCGGWLCNWDKHSFD